MSAEMSRLLRDLGRRVSILERLPSTMSSHAAWAQYAPVVTGLSLGNGSMEARYKRLGTVVHYAGVIRFGPSTTLGTLAISMPLAAAFTSTLVPLGTALIVDISASAYLSAAPRLISPDSMILNATSGARVSGTVPFTFAASDSIGWRVSYEVGPAGG